MTEAEFFMGRFKLADERVMMAKFQDMNDRDGFEISLGMYRSNLALVTEEVFRRFVGKFNGVVVETVQEEQA